MTESNRQEHPLWRHGDFLRLWFGQTTSEVGAKVSTLALPLIAITVLHASVFQVALISTMLTVPYLVFGLQVGVLVDRVLRRPLLITADVGRAVALLSLPVSYLVYHVTLAQLYIVAAVIGSASVVFEIAYRSYLPALVPKEQLVEANAKLTVTTSAVSVVGYSLAGTLISVIGDVSAVLVNVGTYLVSATSLVSIRRREQPTDKAGDRRFRREIGEGLKLVLGDSFLRTITVATGAANLSYALVISVLTLFMSRTLDLPALAIGLVYSAGNAGVVLGSLAARRVTGRLGVGRTLCVSGVISCVGFLLISGTPKPLAVAWLMVSYAVYSFGLPMFNVAQVSLRQAAFPNRLQGRINANIRFVSAGIMSIGSAVSGVLAGIAGIRMSILIGAVVGIGAPILVLLSPMSRKGATAPTPYAER
jgi:MFS family permease